MGGIVVALPINKIISLTNMKNLNPLRKNSNEENMEAQSPEEMNALYERLLQEAESQSKSH